MTVLKTSLRNFLAHKGRMALSAVAVMLSVAFVCGTLVFSDTMTTTFDKLFAATAPDVSVQPKNAIDASERPKNGKPESLPASVLDKAASVDGVDHVEGGVNSMSVTVVNAANKELGPDNGPPTIVGNWTRNELRSMEITEGKAPQRAGEIMVDDGTFDKRKLKLGDELTVITVNGESKARIVGVAGFKATNPGAAVFYFDTPTAQRQLLGETGRFTQLHLTAKPGVSDAQLKQNVNAALGAGQFKVQTQEENADASREGVGQFLDVMKYAMLGFAGVSLLVGIFLIVNTFSMLIAQRTREIGLMRALGSSRGQINGSVLTEAVLLGVVGSLLGVGAGVGLAVGLMKLMGATGMELSTEDLTVAWTTPVVGLTLGVIVTVLAAYTPARRAAKISPMAALRETGMPTEGNSGRVRALVGLVLTAVGVAGLFGAASAEETAPGSLFLGAGVLLTLVGFVALAPLFAGGLVRVFSLVVLRIFGPVGRMAERNALRNPRRTGATGSALMIGLALVACLSVVGSSMVASATSELDKSVGADFIIQGGNKEIVPQAKADIEKSPNLDHVTEYKQVPATLSLPGGKKEKKDLVAADPTYAEDVRREVISGDLAAAYAPGSMSVGDEFAKQHKLSVGDKIQVAFDKGRTGELTIAAITSEDTSLDKGAMYLSLDTARQYVPAAALPLNMIMFAAAEEGKEKQAYAALKDSIAKYHLKVQDQTDFKEDLKNQVGQLLNIVYGLLGLAIIVAVLGVINTLALSVVERTREIGLMRAIGLSRRQLRRMIRLESVVIALFGALLGLGLGMGWGTTAQKLLALEGLGVLDIPWPTIVTVFIASAFVGLFAALLPAFRAGRMNVLRAIASD